MVIWQSDFLVGSIRNGDAPIGSMMVISFQREFPDPKMKVLYHIRPYFGGIFPYIGLIYGRYLHFGILKFPLIIFLGISDGHQDGHQ